MQITLGKINVSFPLLSSPPAKELATIAGDYRAAAQYAAKQERFGSCNFYLQLADAYDPPAPSSLRVTVDWSDEETV